MVSKTTFVKGHLKSTGGSSAQQPPNNTAERLQPYKWEQTHASDLLTATTLRGLAESANNYNTALTASADKLQTTTLGNSNSAISAKLADLTRAKELLQQTLADTTAEQEALSALSVQTKAALESKTQPINATMQWLSIRLQRPKSERTRDGSEIALDRLLATLRESAALLTDTFSAEQSELYRLSVAISALQSDIADKEMALTIDGDTLATTKPAPATVPMPPSMLGTCKPPFDPTQWRGSTKKICANATRVIEVSARLRAKAAEIESLALQKETLAHKELLAENAHSVNVLQSFISKSEATISDAQAEMSSIEATLATATSSRTAKEESSAVVTSRLAMRAQRPARERVFDPAHQALQNELNAMTLAATDLKRSEDRCKADYSRVEAATTGLVFDLDQKKKFLELELDCSAVPIM